MLKGIGLMNEEQGEDAKSEVALLQKLGKGLISDISRVYAEKFSSLHISKFLNYRYDFYLLNGESRSESISKKNFSPLDGGARLFN